MSGKPYCPFCDYQPEGPVIDVTGGIWHVFEVHGYLGFSTWDPEKQMHVVKYARVRTAEEIKEQQKKAAELNEAVEEASRKLSPPPPRREPS